MVYMMRDKDNNELQYIDNLILVCCLSILLSAVLLTINIYFI